MDPLGDGKRTAVIVARNQGAPAILGQELNHLLSEDYILRLNAELSVLPSIDRAARFPQAPACCNRSFSMEPTLIFSRDSELESLLTQAHELELRRAGEQSPPTRSNEAERAMESSGEKRRMLKMSTLGNEDRDVESLTARAFRNGKAKFLFLAIPCLAFLVSFANTASAQSQFGGVIAIGSFSASNGASGPSAVDPIRHIGYVVTCQSLGVGKNSACILGAYREKDGSQLGTFPFTAESPSVEGNVIAVDPILNKVFVTAELAATTGSCGDSGSVVIFDGNNNYSPTVLNLPGPGIQMAVNTHTQQLFIATSGILTCNKVQGQSVFAVSPALVVVDTVHETTTSSNSLTGMPLGLVDVLRINTETNTLFVSEITNDLIYLSATTETPQIESFSGATGVSQSIYTLPLGGFVTSMAVDPIQNVFAVGTHATGTGTNANCAPVLVFLGGSLTSASALDPNSPACQSPGTSENQSFPIANPATSMLYDATVSLGAASFDQLFAYNDTGGLGATGNLQDSVNPAFTTSNTNYFATILDATTDRYYAADGLGVVALASANPVKENLPGAFGFGLGAGGALPITSHGLDPVLDQMIIKGTVWVIHGDVQSTVNLATGAAPSAVAVNPVSGKAYILNGGNNTVSVLQGSLVVATPLVLPGQPVVAAADPYANLIYVAIASAGTSPGQVSVINGSNDTLVGSVAVGVGPASVDVNPATGLAYVSNSADGTVTVLQGNQVITTVAVGKTPKQLAVDSARNRIYVTNFGDGTVSAIDGPTNTTTTIPAGGGPMFLAVDIPDNRVYVVNQTDGSVCFIDGTNLNNPCSTVFTAQTAGLIGTLSGIVLNPTNQTAYLPLQAGSRGCGAEFFGFSTATNSNVGSVNDLGGPCSAGAAVDPLLNRTAILYPDNTTPIQDIGFFEGLVPFGIADTLKVGDQPSAISIDWLNHNVYVTNTADNTVTVTAEETTAPSPLFVTVAPLTQNATTSPSPSFTLTVHNTFVPNAPAVDGVFYAIDGWQDPWQMATPGTAANTYTAAVSTSAGLLPGLHVLFAYATNGLEAYGADLDGSLLIGQIMAYPFLVTSAQQQPPPAATPVISPNGGTFASAPSVTITDATTGANIFYTTDGTIPSTSSTAYNGSFTVGASETVEAIATASGLSQSAVASAAFTITPAITITISPASVQVVAGKTQLFTATVTGTTNTAVTWNVQPSGGGTIDSTGLYTAPATPGTYTITATSVASTSAMASAQVTVTAAVLTATSTSITSSVSTLDSISLPANTALVGNPVTVNFAVTPKSGSGNPTGTVTVGDATGDSCKTTMLTAGAGSCQLNISQVNSGSASVTATYAPDTASSTLFSGSTSPSVTENVTQIVACASPVAPETVAQGGMLTITLTVCVAGDVQAAPSVVASNCPSNTTCNATIAPSAGQPGVNIVTITIITTASAGSVPLLIPSPPGGPLAAPSAWLTVLFLTLMLLLLSRQRSARPRLLWQTAFLLALALCGFSGCNSANSMTTPASNSTPLGNFTLTVKITAGSANVSVPVPFTVTK
jgi:YVTN family beta-propeller protein